MRSLITEYEAPTVPLPVRAVVTDTLTPERLDLEHQQSLSKALSRVLAAEVAEFTFTQIIDGSPTYKSFMDFHFPPPVIDGWPVRSHEALCDGAVERFQALRSSFHPLDLKFEPQALQGFQNQPPGTRLFNLRLLELVAVACHQIATLFFQPQGNKHQEDYNSWVANQRQLKAAGDERYTYIDVQPPVAFYHTWFLDYEQYPRGIHDVVGYWAEASILGGVFLFDRGQSGLECNEVWIHSSFSRGPTTLYTPTLDQFQSLVAFLTLGSDAKPITCPLPIEPSKQNRPRFNRYHATKYFNIFRNRYDSRLPSYFVWPDTFSSHDYPEIDDDHWLLNHMFQIANHEIELDEAKVAEAQERMRNVTPSSPRYTGDRSLYS